MYIYRSPQRTPSSFHPGEVQNAAAHRTPRRTRVARPLVEVGDHRRECVEVLDQFQPARGHADVRLIGNGHFATTVA
jgi:hypothetical protein